MIFQKRTVSLLRWNYPLIYADEWGYRKLTETAPLDEHEWFLSTNIHSNSVMAEASISLNFAVPSLKDDAKDGDEMNIAGNQNP